MHDRLIPRQDPQRVDPYRDGEASELVMERVACTWCHAEIAYLVGDATATCKHCGAQVAPPQARALRTKLMTNVEIPPVQSIWPAWLDGVLAGAWDIACLVGAIGTVVFAAWITVSRERSLVPLVGFFGCLPLAVVTLVGFARRAN